MTHNIDKIYVQDVILYQETFNIAS